MSWFVVRTATRQEKRAEASLRELGFEVCLPLETRWRRHARTREAVTHALFPGYLFAIIPPDRMYFAVEADGVHQVLGNNGKPSEVDSRLIADLTEAEAAGAFDRTAEDRARQLPRVGESVSVTTGQYAGFIGQVIELRGKNRALLMVSLFGRNQKIERPLAELETQRGTTTSGATNGSTPSVAKLAVA